MESLDGVDDQPEWSLFELCGGLPLRLFCLIGLTLAIETADCYAS